MTTFTEHEAAGAIPTGILYAWVVAEKYRPYSYSRKLQTRYHVHGLYPQAPWPKQVRPVVEGEVVTGTRLRREDFYTGKAVLAGAEVIERYGKHVEDYHAAIVAEKAHLKAKEDAERAAREAAELEYRRYWRLDLIDEGWEGSPATCEVCGQRFLFQTRSEAGFVEKEDVHCPNCGAYHTSTTCSSGPYYTKL